MAENTTQSSQKNIVILGGSYGGVSTAHYLLKHAIPKLPDSASYQVILISASSEVICRPACPRALISDDLLPQQKIFFSIPNLFSQYPKHNFRFIHGTATDLDHTNRLVSISSAIDQSIEKKQLPCSCDCNRKLHAVSPSRPEPRCRLPPPKLGRLSHCTSSRKKRRHSRRWSSRY